MGTRERRARERADRRRRITDAAAELFRTDGYACTGVAAIAERAELNVATLYYYFSSKEIIYLAVLVHALDQLVPELENAANVPGSARDQLARVAHTYHAFFSEHPESQAIIHCLQSGLIDPNGEEEADLIARAYAGTSHCVGIVARILADASQRGEFQSFDVRETTIFFWSSLSGVLQIAGNKSIFRSSVEEGMLDRWVDRLVTGLASRP